MKLATLPAVGISFVAVLAARAWVRLAPGRAIRWASSTPVIAADRPAAIDSFSCAVAAIGVRCGATCLEQGVALTLVLAAMRVPARLVIGVDRSGTGFGAHAWVESNGRVILGGADAPKYAPMPIAGA